MFTLTMTLAAKPSKPLHGAGSAPGATSGGIKYEIWMGSDPTCSAKASGRSAPLALSEGDKRVTTVMLVRLLTTKKSYSLSTTCQLKILGFKKKRFSQRGPCPSAEVGTIITVARPRGDTRQRPPQTGELLPEYISY